MSILLARAKALLNLPADADWITLWIIARITSCMEDVSKSGRSLVEEGEEGTPGRGRGQGRDLQGPGAAASLRSRGLAAGLVQEGGIDLIENYCPHLLAMVRRQIGESILKKVQKLATPFVLVQQWGETSWSTSKFPLETFKMNVLSDVQGKNLIYPTCIASLAFPLSFVVRLQKLYSSSKSSWKFFCVMAIH